VKWDFMNKGVAMKATIPWLGALLLAAAAMSSGRADHWWCSSSPPQPNAFTPAGYCCPGWYNPITFPTFGVQPFCPSGNGFGPSVGTPAHLFARSPRDYFMMDDP
jgi:hypothetical protein